MHKRQRTVRMVRGKYNQQTLFERVSNIKNTVIMQSKMSKINGGMKNSS